jgi:hypothetical protein
MTANWPSTYEEAVTRLLEELPEEQRRMLRTMSKSELFKWHFGLGMAIRQRYGLWQSNTALPESCATRGCGYHPDDISMAIVEGAWARLQETDLG